MDADRFWGIVGDSRADFDPDLADGNMDKQQQSLRIMLAALPAEEVAGFDRQFCEHMRRAYTWDLWGVAYILAGGCSDDWFDYFRRWLISMGRGVYDAALADAESLAGPARSPGVEDVFFEEFGAIAEDLYRQKTGEAMPDHGIALPPEPLGDEWEETEEALQQRFPRVWKERGWDRN